MKKTYFFILLILPAILLSVSGCFQSGKQNASQILEDSVRHSKKNILMAFNTVRSQYQRKADLIPSLINSVRTDNPLALESDAVQQLINGRNEFEEYRFFFDMNTSEQDISTAMAGFFNMADRLDEPFVSFLTIVDNNTNSRFQELLSQLEGTENRISVGRMDLFSLMRKHNKTFPHNQIQIVLPNNAATKAPVVVF